MKGASGKPLTGQDVRISATNGLGTISGVWDNGDGTYSATFMASNQPGTEIIKITAGGVTQTVNITLDTPQAQARIVVLTTSVNSGDDIRISYSGAPGNSSDWIGLFNVNSADTAYLSFQFLKTTYLVMMKQVKASLYR